MIMQPVVRERPGRATTARHPELQALVGRALVDDEFRCGLLNGHRRECIAEFALSADEERAVARIDAPDLTSFAAQLDGWINHREPVLARIRARAAVPVAA
jgi:hypothetical protein